MAAKNVLGPVVMLGVVRKIPCGFIIGAQLSRRRIDVRDEPSNELPQIHNVFDGGFR